MQAKDLYTFIENPTLMTKSNVEDLQKLVQDFPYFQAAHLLLSVASKKWDASVYQKSLKKAAIVVNNRSQLFKLVSAADEVITLKEGQTPLVTTEKEILTQEDNTGQELEILKAAELSTEEKIVAKISQDAKIEDEFEKEIGKEVVNSFVGKELLKTTQVHKPLLPKEEPESFSDWLVYLKNNNGQPYSSVEPSTIKKEEKAEERQALELPLKEDNRKLKNKAIIDKIIEKNPGLIRTKEEQKFFIPDTKAKESLLENEHLVTETLARIYALQGSVNKAVRAYEILSLKYPQKSAYFASLIQKLKEN